MPDSLFRRREERHYPRALYGLALDLFALVQHWQPTVRGAERGRVFEGLLYRYAEARRLPLTERAGSRTVRRVRPASGFRHENDAVLAFPDFTVHCEIKHLSGELPKNELLVFNQKGIDYLVAEGGALRKLPFYRVILSAGLVSPEARRFAAQWGILVVEPDRPPLLLLRDLCGRVVPPLRHVTTQEQDEIWAEVPRLVAPLQDQLARVGRLVQQGEGCVIGEYRLTWAIDHVQRVIGGPLLGRTRRAHPSWLEDRFDQVGSVCGPEADARADSRNAYTSPTRV